MIGACLIDLEKAFDSVWIKGLLYELKKKQFPKPILYLIASMTENREIVTAFGKNISTKSFPIEDGLMQGMVNSPILFNIYNSDILKLFGLNSEPK